MAGEIYIVEETPIVWTDGGTPAMDMGGLTADAVRVGARQDLGSGARAEWYHWRVKINGFTAAPVVDETVNIYLATSDGTIEDGEVGTADAAGTTASLPNLWPLGVAVVQTTTAGDNLQSSGFIRILHRYVSPVIHNDTANVLLATADDHQFILTPVASVPQ